MVLCRPQVAYLWPIAGPELEQAIYLRFSRSHSADSRGWRERAVHIASLLCDTVYSPSKQLYQDGRASRQEQILSLARCYIRFRLVLESVAGWYWNQVTTLPGASLQHGVEVCTILYTSPTGTQAVSSWYQMNLLWHNMTIVQAGAKMACDGSN